ncbi:MerR family transcriptional regulator [Microbacterium sp. MYb62]|uniref:MerR family transcriptional regulator n=1 Tax=Microbacterium sp. MYb62 TaxID=1848690 RepID=UPI000CFC44FB|nr:MerR family transcriptional regulator [Microbacterium sp. MYb62]PRB15163.1 hypothetical protein CQ042_09470 [Microbacterium sp. MYb62]
MAQSQEWADLPLPVGGHRDFQTISTFAQAVGLSASALRQYGENGLLPPADVEERTGYRYYAPQQQQRAIWIRRLRDAGLDMGRIRLVLAGDAAQADVVLTEWLRDIRDRSMSAEALVADLKLSLRSGSGANPIQRTRARFDAAVLTAALRQVRTAAAAGDLHFDGVLVEIDSRSAAVVATDRYLLMARTEVAREVEGPPARVRLDPTIVFPWLRGRWDVELVVDMAVGRDGGVREAAVRLEDAEGEALVVPQGKDRFPTVHRLLRGGRGSSGRFRFGREELDTFIAGADDAGLLLTADGSGTGVLTSGSRHLAGTTGGEPCALRVSGQVLGRVVDAALGNEVICDVVGPDEPIEWRAPAQPDFAAVMMAQPG